MKGFQIAVSARGDGWRGERGDQERQLPVDYSFVRATLEGIAKLYENEAIEWDTRAAVMMRVGYDG